ncbi:MAG: AAA family ATPase [Coriobacteriia bacterium]|nr:AAA family ATPase [Coriobacteriia bacterium]
MGLITVIDQSGEYANVVGTLSASQPDAEVRSTQSIAGIVFEAEAPFVVVVAPSATPSIGFDVVRAADAAGAHTSVVIIANEVDTDLMRSAMKAGVADVVSAQDPASDIARAIMDAYTVAAARRIVLAERAEAAATPSGGRVVTVFSTKGGVGKTVLATNLGAALSKSLDLRTAVVDLDLQFGDVGIMLGLAPERTIADVAASIERLDADLLKGHMMHHDSGLDVLLAPVRPEDAETVTTGRIDRILSLLREMYDIVVIDTAASLDEVVLTALDRSDAVYAVTMMDVASIKNMRISVQKLVQLGYANGLVRVVLNRADSKVWLEPHEVERAVGSEIFARIPSDRIVPRSVNKGRPVVLDEPRSDVAKAMVRIAESIADAAGRESSHVT